MPAIDRGLNGPQLSAGLAAIPATPTAVSAFRSKVKSVFVSNPTGGSITVSIRSGGIAGTIVGVMVVATNDNATWPKYLEDGADGIIFPSGISWGASGAGAFGEVIGVTATV